MDLKVFVAAHKPVDLPGDAVYQPIQVGRAVAKVTLDFPGDDTGDHISTLNPTYCELTGLYWAWRNTDHDALGLVHYRRYFAGRAGGPATGAELRSMLGSADVVVPRRRHYVIQTVRAQYANSHHAEDLEAARSAVAAVDRASVGAFDRVMRARSISLYNMFLMRRPLVDDYCGWLFAILRDAGQRISMDSYGPQQRRVMGYLGERLFNVWLEAHPSLTVSRERVYEQERTPAIIAGTRMVGRMVGWGRAE